MVQIVAIFVYGPTTVKIKTVNVRMDETITSRVGVQLYLPGVACKCDHACQPCGCGFPMELGAKVKTIKLFSGVSGGVFTKICTHENFPLYSISGVDAGFGKGGLK